MRLAVAVLVTLVFATSGFSATNAKKPPAWLWTSAVAARQVSTLDIWPTEGTLSGVRCQGKGKAVAKRYGAFRCTATLTPKRLADPKQPVSFWVKVRRQGTGQPCASPSGLGVIPSGCLNPSGARAAGSGSEAAAATQGKIGGPGGAYQGPVGCLGYGAGFWRCWIGTGEDTASSGHSVVVFLASGPSVTIVNMPAA